jgi:hypothetical protein
MITSFGTKDYKVKNVNYWGVKFFGGGHFFKLDIDEEMV